MAAASVYVVALSVTGAIDDTSADENANVCTLDTACNVPGLKKVELALTAATPAWNPIICGGTLEVAVGAGADIKPCARSDLNRVSY